MSSFNANRNQLGVRFDGGNSSMMVDTTYDDSYTGLAFDPARASDLRGSSATAGGFAQECPHS
jgi:hypothetical protein